MRTILINLNSQAQGNSKLRPRLVPARGKCSRKGGIKTKRPVALQKFKSLKVTPIASNKSGKKLGDNVFELDNYWADEAEGLAESTFCPSEFNPTPLIRSRF